MPIKILYKNAHTSLFIIAKKLELTQMFINRRLYIFFILSVGTRRMYFNIVKDIYYRSIANIIPKGKS